MPRMLGVGGRSALPRTPTTPARSSIFAPLLLGFPRPDAGTWPPFHVGRAVHRGVRREDIRREKSVPRAGPGAQQIQPLRPIITREEAGNAEALSHLPVGVHRAKGNSNEDTPIGCCNRNSRGQRRVCPRCTKSVAFKSECQPKRSSLVSATNSTAGAKQLGPSRVYRHQNHA